METLAVRYARLQKEMDGLYAGDAISAAADRVLAELPAGPLTLISTSDQGAGLAAVCASRRSDATSWRKVSLVAPNAVGTRGDVVVIEPVDAGTGWRQAVERSYPGSRVVVVSSLARDTLVAA